MKEPIHQFDATAPDGSIYKIEAYGSFAGVFDYRVHWQITELRTALGELVKKHEKGKYEIIESGIHLTSTSPDAV